VRRVREGNHKNSKAEETKRGRGGETPDASKGDAKLLVFWERRKESTGKVFGKRV